MSYSDQWKFLSARIQGLLQAGELHARFLSVRSSDSYGRTARLRENMISALAAVKAYRQTYRASLPASGTAAIDDFLLKAEALVADTSGTPDSREERVWAALIMFGSFQTELSFLLADVQQTIRSRTDRAFEHLQRSIVADSEFRAKWQSAFSKGETDCEALGAVHLLSHGIWAFKANAAGERTDLLYQDVLNVTAVERAADGLVLTEWKKKTEKDDAASLYENALAQAKLYAQGVLGGIELTTYRYLVLVSKKRVVVPSDATLAGVVYRHINISVDPDTPSKEAKTIARKKK